LGRLLLAGLVVLCASYFPGWRFKHMTAAEHLEAANIALDEQSYGECLRHLDALAPDAPEVVALKRKLAAARQIETATQQKAATDQQAEETRRASQQIATHELEQNLRNMGYDVTVAQSKNPEEITIASRGFDDSAQRDRFLAFFRGTNSPAAAACVAGIQAVRLKGPGLFFGFSDKYSLDCYTK
jgi:hypothetical protein